MPYQPAVTPDSRPIAQGIAAAGNSIADGMESLRKQREQNEAADVTLEHLHTVSPDLLEPYLRKNGDTETPSAELLSKFLGNATRAKKEALIGSTAAAALMKSRQQQMGMEQQRVGFEGQRVQQQGQQIAMQGQQFNERMRADKTQFAIQQQQDIARRKAQGKVDMVRMPDGSTMVVNGSGNFSVQRPAQGETTTPPPPWAAQAMASDKSLYWTGEALRSKPADPMAAYQQMQQPGGVAPAQAPGLPPLPQKHATAEDVKNDGSLSREQKAEILRKQFGFR